MLNETELNKRMNESIEWIKEYVKKTGAKGVVVGNSGGKDSATVIAMSVKALGKENVITVSMPCNSIKEDMEDAKLVAKAFEVKFIECDLTETYSIIEKQLNKSINECQLSEISKDAKINKTSSTAITTIEVIKFERNSESALA